MTFEDVVKQLQMNNRSEAGRDSRQTKMLGDLKTAIEGLTVATESAEEPDAAQEEEQKDERSRAKKLLDAVGGLWNVNLGYSCEPIKKAINDQLKTMPYCNTFRGITNDKAIELSYKLK